MDYEKRRYGMYEMKEQDLESAPSLDLPALTIEKFYLPKDGGKMMVFFANVKKSWKPADGCPFCHRQDTLILSGRTKPRVIRDVVRNNYCVQIVMQSPRMLCNECHQRFVPTIDGIVENRSMTQRLLDFVKVESFLQPHTTLQERTGLSIQTIQNIMDDEIERFEQLRRDNPIEAPEVLGIDEKHIQHVMRGTLVDVQNGELLDMMENNAAETMKDAIKKLKGWDKNIRVVTTDMSNQYLKWLPTLLPNATIVIDKFHVIQDVEKKMASAKNALYAYRKELIEAIKDDEERARQMAILRIVHDNKRLFNYSMDSIVREKSGKRILKLNTVMDAFSEFSLLRMMYFYIEDMYTKETREEAEQAWNEWQELLPPSSSKKDYQDWCKEHNVDSKCFEAFQSLTRTGFTFYKPYILNYFIQGCRYTNATTEGLNNLIESINISGNGYHFKHLRAKALYASLVHERVVYSFDIKTVKAWKPTMSMQTTTSRGNAGIMVTTTKYCFEQKTQQENIEFPNVLKNNDHLIQIFSNDTTKNAMSLSDFYDEDEVIFTAWKVLQPDPTLRKAEQLLAEEDEAEA